MKKTFVLLMILVALLAACGGVKEFKSDAGKFSVDTPVTLKEETQSVDSEVGKLDMHSFTGDNRNGAYLVAYIDYPAGTLEQNDIEAMFDSERDYFLSSVSGTLTSEKSVTIKDYPGREIIAEGQTDTGKAAKIKLRVYLVGDRQYTVMVIGDKEKLKDADMIAFLDSFKLLD